MDTDTDAPPGEKRQESRRPAATYLPIHEPAETLLTTTIRGLYPVAKPFLLLLTNYYLLLIAKLICW